MSGEATHPTLPLRARWAFMRDGVSDLLFPLRQKEQFYQHRRQLVEPQSPELASFISMCLTYEPVERPSFRTVLRELSKSPSTVLRVLTALEQLAINHTG